MSIIVVVKKAGKVVIAERLLKVLNDFTADEMTNQIIYI